MATAPAPTPWFALAGAPAVGAALLPLDSLPDGQATLWQPAPPLPGTKPLPGLIVLREGSAVRAFVNRCPHFGVPLAQRQTLLIQASGRSISCNVHYARFRWGDGVCESGDCLGEALESVALTVDPTGMVCLGAP